MEFFCDVRIGQSFKKEKEETKNVNILYFQTLKTVIFVCETENCAGEWE